MKTTAPAPASLQTPPPSVKFTPLALAALANGVALADVRAYMAAR